MCKKVQLAVSSPTTSFYCGVNIASCMQVRGHGAVFHTCSLTLTQKVIPQSNCHLVPVPDIEIDSLIIQVRQWVSSKNNFLSMCDKSVVKLFFKFHYNAAFPEITDHLLIYKGMRLILVCLVHAMPKTHP